jgi:hypothetical protein
VNYMAVGFAVKGRIARLFARASKLGLSTSISANNVEIDGVGV